MELQVENREKDPKKHNRKITKSPTTFNIKLTEEQKAAKAVCYDNQMIFLTGRPGTSKTTIACHVALDLLIKRVVGKIIVTRPLVNVGKDMGFLPGDASGFKEGKLAPYVAPVLQTMYKLRNPAEIDLMIEKGQIEIVPIQFVRGLNFEDAVVIIEETQNCDTEELKAITTRLCEDAKMIFTSDVNQIDLYNKDRSAGHFIKQLATLEGVAVVELTENFRSPLALAVMDMIDVAVRDKNKIEI